MSFDVGLYSAIFAMVIAATIAIPCIKYKRWPDNQQVLLLLFALLGVASGIKIVWLCMSLTKEALGPLADDRGVIVIGGIATILFAGRESVDLWKKAARI